MNLKAVVFGIVVGAGCACNTDTREPENREPDSWVAVATFLNPHVSEEGNRALTILTAALKANGIDAIAAGSHGYSLNVAARDECKARSVVARTIATNGLQASLTHAVSRDG